MVPYDVGNFLIAKGSVKVIKIVNTTLKIGISGGIACPGGNIMPTVKPVTGKIVEVKDGNIVKVFCLVDDHLSIRIRFDHHVVPVSVIVGIRRSDFHGSARIVQVKM